MMLPRALPEGNSSLLKAVPFRKPYYGRDYQTLFGNEITILLRRILKTEKSAKILGFH